MKIIQLLKAVACGIRVLRNQAELAGTEAIYITGSHATSTLHLVLHVGP